MAVKSEILYKNFEAFGKYQVIQYVWICIAMCLVSMTHVNYVFVSEDDNHRCVVPECESGNSTVKLPSWWPHNDDPKCFKPVLDDHKYVANNTCYNTSFLELVEECDEWIFEDNNSIVSEFKLGCQSWKSTLVGTIHNAGMIISMMMSGWVADKIGRKPTVVICTVGGSIGFIKIFMTNYYFYLLIEFLESFLTSGLYTVAVILFIEVGGESKRVSAGVIFAYSAYAGEILYAFIAMGFKYWKLIIASVYAPMILFLSYSILLKESLRWQMLRGKIDEAKETLKLMARMNKIQISDEQIDDINSDELVSKFDVKVQKEKESVKDLMASKEIMTRLVVTSFCYFTSSFLYYGLLVHCVFLPGNKYTNFILSALTSFPGDLLAYYTFNYIGRKITLQCSYIACAIFLIAQTFCPEEILWLKVLLFMLGKLTVVICFTGIYTYSLELFPTSVRGSLVGCGNTAARIGSMLAPLTPLLVTQFSWLPSILFSSASMVAAFLLIFTPETKFLPLFDTVAQVEAYKNKVTTHL